MKSLNEKYLILEIEQLVNFTQSETNIADDKILKNAKELAEQYGIDNERFEYLFQQAQNLRGRKL